MSNTERVFSEAAVEAAKAEIKRTVMARYGGDLLGGALVSVEVSNADAVAYLMGATVEDLLRKGSDGS